MDEAVSAPRRQLQRLQPVREAVPGVPQVPRVARRVSLDEVEEDDMDSLLESIGEELLTEELEELEKQWRQLEEEVEAEQHPTVPQSKQMTVKILQSFYGLLNQVLDYMEEMDPENERVGLVRRRHLVMRRGRQQCSPPSIAGLRRNPPTLRLLPPTSLIPAKSPTPAMNLSPAPPKVATPALMFLRHCCCRHRRLM